MPSRSGVTAPWACCAIGGTRRDNKADAATSLSGLLNRSPMLDFRELNDDQLLMAELIFDEFRDKDLKPAYLADADPKRALLDRRVVCDLLGFDQTVYEAVRRLAAKWCAEPSVHGGKQRPKNATLII